ncbi:MAG TPA: O-antigen ligase family protein, partial [Actinomycetota bacterium]|nr:O-antigen ligase family protein [Actinomycetota bacterium]
SAVLWALVLPFPYALVSPLYLGLAGWLVDMLPFVVLAGWAAVIGRWAWGLWQERRLPRGGRWIWLPIFLVGWMIVGLTALDLSEIKHFILLFSIQILISGTVLAVVDQLEDVEDRTKVVAGLMGFVVVLAVGVFLQWIGVPIQPLQDETVSARAEAAYGVDAFPNDTGMIKYARAQNGGAYDLTKKLERVANDTGGLPPHEVFLPSTTAFGGGQLLIRFEGSARDYEDELADANVSLIFDNVGVAPANTVPRLRSFPRNALTFAGLCAALFPLGFFLLWSDDRRRQWLGRLAIIACLMGAGFSIARGAWAAILIGGIYLLIDGPLPWGRKMQYVGAFLAGAVVLTAVFMLKYDSNPLTARAGGDSSVEVRSNLYADTVQSLEPRYFVTGFGMTLSRDTDSTSYGELGEYVPPSGTHSTYLNYLFRMGIPGLLGILALYGLALAHSRTAARSFSGTRAVLATLLATAVIIAAAHALILSLYVEPVYTLGISLLLGLGMAHGKLPRSIIPWRKPTAA